MATRLAIANQKGGVGKTTTSVNLAAALERLGQRVLLIDLDPQGNATMGSGIDKRQLVRSIYDVLIGDCEPADALLQSEVAGYHLWPANRELSGAEVELIPLEARERRLSHAIDAVADRFDYVIIDAPPSLSMLTLNALCAAEQIVIPMQCEYYALEGLSDLVATIRKVHANFNPGLQILGLLRVMFDARITLAQQVSLQLEQHFGDKVFKAVIPRNVRLAEAPSHGMPGVCFDPASRGAQAYMEFGRELLARHQPGAATTPPVAAGPADPKRHRDAPPAGPAAAARPVAQVAAGHTDPSVRSDQSPS